MFETRLKWLAALLLLPAVAIVARLAHLQIAQADSYRAIADALLTRPVRYLQPVRGSILDRHDRVLVEDRPACDLCVHYGVLSGNSEALLRAFARSVRRRGDAPADQTLDETASDLRHRLAETWTQLAQLTGVPAEELLNRAENITRRVERVRRQWIERGGEGPIREETLFHPLIEGVDESVALRARQLLEHLPWIDVAPAAQRVMHAADPLVHVLGRVGRVTAEAIQRDPLSDDEWRRLTPDGRCGVSGVERVADAVLRGARGDETRDLRGALLKRQEPQRGQDVRLTIDRDLQQRLLDILARAVEKSDHPAGASAVVIDVASGDVLALVSSPVYSYAEYSQRYAELRDDTRRLPLRFRAVSDAFPPGSTCKAITLVGALSDARTSPNERIHCRGALLPDQPTHFRCWIYNQYGTTHDAEMVDGQRGEDAIRNSCNIYFYEMGGRLGPARLCQWFDEFRLGRTQGTGLIEESPGIVPHESYLRFAQNRGYVPSDAWNYAIGQGEVTATPLQVANVAAAIARGRWKPVQLVRLESGRPLTVPVEPERELSEPALRVLRTGMWRVVNEKGGTAEKHARLVSAGYELCGKTGSAQVVPRVLTSRYIFEWPDGVRDSVEARSEAEARAHFGDAHVKLVGSRAAQRYPELGQDGKLPSHAWFMGYTQLKSTPRGSPATGRAYAIAVLIEFGGGGGSVAGPVAREIAQVLLGGQEVGWLDDAPAPPRQQQGADGLPMSNAFSGLEPTPALRRRGAPPQAAAWHIERMVDDKHAEFEAR